ncbi:MAG: hypothetical protein K2X93_10560 [Candidatus Obscuribacterales bacterium]|nr:hypothetical protein [Candidatus Obscuribacterales bacterium]
MNARSIIVGLVVLVLVGGGIFFYRDYQYREIHGRVTQVGLITWDQEVESTRDAKPVLVYFYRENEKNAPNPAQDKEVSKFAWNNAGKVKVVAVNIAHLENVPLAIAHGTLRVPGFVILRGDKVYVGPAGVFTKSDDLQSFLERNPSSADGSVQKGTQPSTHPTKP